MCNSFFKTLSCFTIFVFSIACLALGQQPTSSAVAGGRGGSPFIDAAPQSGARVQEVRIHAGDIVDAVQVVYRLRDGRSVSTRRHGGSGGREHVFQLDSDEYIVAVSGRYGNQIDSITIHTNKRSSQRFGGSGGDRDFNIEAPYGQQAVGFVGRSGEFLDAVGLIFQPINTRQPAQTPLYGGRGGRAFTEDEIPLGAQLSEIRIRAGERVDSIQAVYTLEDGRVVEGPRHGGSGGRQNMFRLSPDEYVTGIYGRFGDVIDSITIRTNRRTSPTYGGRGGSRDFQIDVPGGAMATGFIGRSGDSLDAIGLLYSNAGTSRGNSRGLPRRNRNRSIW